jgi:hypothetical protein
MQTSGIDPYDEQPILPPPSMPSSYVHAMVGVLNPDPGMRDAYNALWDVIRFQGPNPIAAALKSELAAARCQMGNTDLEISPSDIKVVPPSFIRDLSFEKIYGYGPGSDNQDLAMGHDLAVSAYSQSGGLVDEACSLWGGRDAAIGFACTEEALEGEVWPNGGVKHLATTFFPGQAIYESTAVALKTAALLDHRDPELSLEPSDPAAYGFSGGFRAGFPLNLPSESRGCTEILPQLRISEVSFQDDHTILKDQLGGARPIEDPIWQDTNIDGSPESNDPVAYSRATRMKVIAKFTIDPPLNTSIEGVTIEGDGPGALDFRVTGVTLSGSTTSIPATPSSDVLPAETSLFDPLSIDWKFSLDGVNFVDAGSSRHKVYVTLGPPLTYETFLTALDLATANPGARTAAEAIEMTWAAFSRPSDIMTWDDRELFYYKPGAGFATRLNSSVQLLTGAIGSGQCSAFAQLFKQALAAHGIASEYVTIEAKDLSAFLVKHWTFGPASFPEASEFRWKLIMSEPQETGEPFGMVPPLAMNVYGDMRSESGISSQNTPTPSEKVFWRHYIVKVAEAKGDPYFDPPYGITYADADDFERKAVEGYVAKFAGDAGGHYRVRMSSGQKNIKFNE